jgi:hypothetical protein
MTITPFEIEDKYKLFQVAGAHTLGCGNCQLPQIDNVHLIPWLRPSGGSSCCTGPLIGDVSQRGDIGLTAVPVIRLEDIPTISTPCQQLACKRFSEL